MSIVFTAEQEELRNVVRRFLMDVSPESEVRRLMETDEGFDQAVWADLGTKLGVCGLAVPTEFGGAGASFVEVGVVLEELGRTLACVPFLSSVVLAQSLLLASADNDACQRWLPGLAEGTLRATVAMAEAGGRWDGGDVATRAVRVGDRWALSGSKSFVLDGHTADLLLVSAVTDAGLSLFAVEAADPTVTRSALPTMDQTRKLAQVEFDATSADPIGEPGDASAPLLRMLDTAAAGLAVESVGAAQRVLEMSVEYSKNRIQFGRPIGSFQAIKHKCADMLVDVESSKSAAYHAVHAASEDPAELPIASCLAKAYCSDAFFRVAAENIQVHGGIGFTWEHPAHLYFKRAASSRLLFGDPAYHRELLAQRIEL